MTEARPTLSFPGAGLGPAALDRPAPRPEARPVARPATKATGRTAEKRIPLHVGVAVGISAGVYAISLAGVTSLQAETERATAVERAPVVGVVNELTAANDRLVQRLTGAAARYDATATDYDALTKGLAAYEAGLTGLAKSVKAIQGSSVAMPRFSGGSTSITRTTINVTQPAVHATTGASAKP